MTKITDFQQAKAKLAQERLSGSINGFEHIVVATAVSGLKALTEPQTLPDRVAQRLMEVSATEAMMRAEDE